MDDAGPALAALDPATRCRTIRDHTERLAAALTPEDQCVQSMPDASPAKWHRAHTTWFFEEFVLTPFLPGYRVFDPDSRFLFNSYYETVGARHPRPVRGLLTRPSADEVGAFRAAVDAGLARLLCDLPPEAAPLIELGLNHEQQHQELLVTDMLHAFAQSPLYPALLPGWKDAPSDPHQGFVSFDGGLADIGHNARGFAFDNEGPRRRTYLAPVPARHPPSAQSRLARFHAGWWLPQPAALDVGWLGAGAAGGLVGAALLAGPRRRLVADGARRPRASRSPTRRFATSAGTRLTPSPVGPAHACRPRLSGKWHPPTGGCTT